MSVKQAIVLAGGLGTRLRPLTEELPKVLVKLKGRALLEHVLELLGDAGVERVVLGVGRQAHGQKIIEHFGYSWSGMDISYVIEEKPAGTAGPLLLLPPEQLDERFWMLNGDNLFDLNFSRFEDFHLSKHAIATIALTTAPDCSAYGCARLVGGCAIERFVEKGQSGPGLISGGYYLCERKIRDYLPACACSASLERDVFPKIAAAGGLFGYYDRGAWFDVGTPKALEEAEHSWRGAGSLIKAFRIFWQGQSNRSVSRWLMRPSRAC